MGVKSVVETAALLLAVTGVGVAARIPSGTQIQIRLSTEINTSTAKAGDAFQALVIAPVVVEGRVAMAAGTTLAGHVKEATAAVNPDDQAVLALAFDEIRDASGNKASIAAKLSAVDNARESLDADGRIQGIIASKTGSGRLDQGINKVSEKYPIVRGAVGNRETGGAEGRRRQHRLQSRGGNDDRADQAAGLDRRCQDAGHRFH